MKKILAFAAVLGLILSGCGQSAAVDTANTTENAEIPETTLVRMEETTGSSAEDMEFSQVPNPEYVSVSYIRQHFETFDQETGETLLVNFDVDFPHVSVSGNPEASQKITEVLVNASSRFLKGIQIEGDLYAPMGQEKVSQQAKEDFPMRGEAFLPYAVERTYEITRGDDRMLSIMAQDYMYMGGAHGSCMRTYLNFDTKTGELLTFGDLTEGPNGLWAKVMEVMRNLAAEDPDVRDRMDFVEEDQREAALAALIREGSWFFEGDHMVLESQQYELGAYAAGMVRFPIPVSELQNDLRPEYLPVQEERGDLILTDKTGMFAMDVIQQGEYPVELYLEAGKPVMQVKVFTLEPYENGEGVHKGKTLWAAGKMENCALQLLVEIPELIPNLGVEFIGRDGAPHAYAITQSGEDGSYFLMELDLY